MEDYRSELTAVTSELSSVEQQLDELLQRQNDLMRRKDELEAILTRNSADSSKVDHNWNKTDFSWSEKLQETLKSVFNIKDLRPMQLQTMNVTMSGRDCILIMPTGGGKSLCFQLPAVLSKGITLVVSPLVALMEDQVMSVNSYHIDAAMLNADCSKEKVKKIQDDMIDHNATLKLLYVTPEKLSKSKRFMARLEKMYKVGRFSRLVIDEVHCCSQWGHDFRPDYKFLGIMKRQFPDVPILGLTATATTSVLDDVKKILDIQSCELFRASFNRPNLFYEVREKSSIQKDVVCDMEKLIKAKFHNKSGIIYTFSKKECEEVASSLQSLGIKAGCYHADLTANERSKVHRAWLENSVHVVVATIAFGMGIDKPDVRFVIHHSISKSMENLYQESGRAGRDGARSHCIVYYRFQDVFRQSAMVMAEQTGLNNLYGILSYCIDISRCRRCVIARYFGEVWEPSQCNRMCDVCNADYASGKMDITTFCINALKILEQAVTIDNKLTAIKLLDAWQGKGPTVNRVKGTSTDKSKEVLEGYLALMLTKQFIREDFHFTPYSTISYLVPGPKANLIRNGSQKILINVKQKKKVEPSELQKSSTKSLDYSSSPSSTNVKVIKDKTRTPGQNSDKVQMKSPKADVKESKRLFQPKKRRIIESSDSDLSDLDLGDSVPCKKKSKISCAATENNRIKNVREESRSISTGNMPVKASSSSKRAIVIDSD